MLTPVLPPDAANDNNYRHRPLPPPDTMTNPRRPWPPRSVAEVLRTGRIPNNSIGDLLARFRLTGPDDAPLPTDLWKGRDLRGFLGRLTSEAFLFLRLAELTLLGVKNPGACAQGTISTSEGAKILNLDFKLITHTHPGAAGFGIIPRER